MGKADGGLRLLFRQRLREGIMWTSIESGITAGGIPDSNYLAHNGVEGWIEFKSTDRNSVKFQPEQIGHLTRRRRYGGAALVAVRYRHDGGPRKGAALDQLLIYDAAVTPALARDGLAGAEPLLREAGGPARWRWPAVRALLLRPPRGVSGPAT